MTEKLQWLLFNHYCPDLTGHCLPDRFYNWPLLARDSGKCSFQTSIPHKTGKKTEKELFMSKHKPPSTKNKNKSKQTNETVSIMTYHPSFFYREERVKAHIQCLQKRVWDHFEACVSAGMSKILLLYILILFKSEYTIFSFKKQNPGEMCTWMLRIIASKFIISHVVSIWMSLSLILRYPYKRNVIILIS